MNLLIKKYIDKFGIKKSCEIYKNNISKTDPKYNIIDYVETRWYIMYDHLVNIKNGYELHLKESTEDIFSINRSIEIFKIFNETQGTLERDRTNLFDEFTILCDM